ncbi:TonB-dependent receptor [Roseateles koreensis]|uniref:TonB-dependent receptor n=1 Tax=Roseateles koreensis TaxID=2987526 RepID=UPI0030B894C1
MSIAAAQAALFWSAAAMAQSTPPASPDAAASPAASGNSKSPMALETVVIKGQRAALASAQKIKQNSDEIVDSIVADDIGKLPDRSVTEVLQRIVGVAIDRTMAKGDPEHFSIEGSGITIRGLTFVRSELNGRDAFSANGGRSLNFEDVPPELMAGVDVYKNPSAEQIEGSIGGLVNLRTAMPFDFDGMKAAVSVQDSYSVLRRKSSPSVSGMFSNRWKTDVGDFGLLVDLAHSESALRTDAFQVEPYYPRSDVVAGQTVWIPKGSQWRTLEFDRKRDGQYLALQWKNEKFASDVTYFRSKYKMTWNENAIFAQSTPYNITVDPGATYDANGALVKGTLRDAADGGINFGADTRVATRNSSTQDLAWKFTWHASDRWTFRSDLQFVKAETSSLDSTVATGVQMAKENIDLSGGVPRLSFDAADRAALADPSSYYWAFTMEHMDKSVANEKSWKGDALFKFEDPVLIDLRFGVRLTDRDALTQNSNPGYNWAAITQPWQVGWNISGLAKLGDPRFSGNTNLHAFNNFFNNNTSVPSLVFPNTSTASGFPDSYTALHKYHDILCAEQTAAQGWGSCDAWKAATFGTDPAGTNDQRERTQAAFSQLRFGFDDWKLPVDGNVGLRLVHTDATAHGYTVFTSNVPTPPSGSSLAGSPVPIIPAFAEAQNFSNAYTNALPSLNLRLKASDKLQFRFGFATSMSRPDFSQLQAYTSLTQTVDKHTVANPDGSTSIVIDAVHQTGTASGNPMLKPITAQNTDLTAEWYFDRTGSFTVAAFNKQMHDIIINQTYVKQLMDVNGKPQDFTVTGPVNGANGTARGVELAFQQYFDKLPGWMSGFGVSANYTFVDSHQSLYNPVNQAYCSGGDGTAANLNLNLNGCDVNGRTFGDLPLANMSRHSYNLAFLYDQGPISARIAYSWRSKYLQAVNVNGTQGTDGTDTNPASSTVGQHNVAWGLPVWADAYGQMDASIFYKVTDKFTIGLEGRNLTDSTYKQLMDQHIGMKGRAWFAVGPSYSVQASYSF